MIFPINTDAPIYHWPLGTLLLIAANVWAFVVTGGGYPGNEAAWEGWVLEFGNGLHPSEWITSAFLHFGVGHLIGNMFFLWVFGLVVEGKLGWWWFLPLYFGLAGLHGMIEQTLMLGYTGFSEGSGGASGVIFALMAMSLVWAPKNEVSCLLVIFLRIFTFEVTILTLSIFYLGVQILVAWLTNFAMSSEVIHLLGALVGLGAGIGLLKLGWVDCEKWDLFSVLKEDHRRRSLDSYRGLE